MLKKISRWRAIKNTPKLYHGNIVKLPETFTTLGEVIEIDSDEKICLETDGETLGHSPFKFTIVRKTIYVVIP